MGSVIGYAGLSHLGLVSSIAAAAKGFQVIAFDARHDLVAALRAGQMPVHEPGLDELRHAHGSRLRFTSSSCDLQACDVVVLSIDIPTDAANQSDLTALDALAESVLGEMSPNTVLVVLSQVRPGYTRRLASALAAKKVELYYQVETLIFGRAVERAMQPERIIVGCNDPAQPLPGVYRNFLEAFACAILPMRYESAELTKIAINIFLTASVTATNTLAGVCEAIDADWSEIAPALRLDKRIGPHAYLTPGLGLAGGNLERDLVTVTSLAAEHDVEAGLIRAFQANSQHRREWALRALHANLGPGSTSEPDAQARNRAYSLACVSGSIGIDRTPVIAVWGLAYKENTHSTKNSAALSLIEALPGFTVRAYDPQVKATSAGAVPIELCATPLEACAGADALVIMTPWPEFRQVDPGQVAGAMRGRLLIDPFGCIAVGQLDFAYFRMGYSPGAAQGAASHQERKAA